MTGRNIQKKITDTVRFVPKALDFENNGRLELKNPASALKFLTLYLVLISTTEFKEYDEDKLLENYKFIKSHLKQNKRISNTEFLSDPPKNIIYILQDNICFAVSIVKGLQT